MNRLIFTMCTIFLMASCSSTGVSSRSDLQKGAAVNAHAQSESERANAFFERVFNEAVMRSPTYQSYLGIKVDQDKWDDLSDAKQVKELKIAKRNLKELKETIDFNKLDRQAKISYRLFEKSVNQQIRRHDYRFHSYPVNQMYGAQSTIPSFLINIHQVTELKDAEAYVTRLGGVDQQIKQVIENLKIREKKGIVAPKFVYPYAINDIDNVLTGRPFNSAAQTDSALLADIKKKVDRLEIDEAKKAHVIDSAINSLLVSVKPAFKSLRAYLVDLEKRATTDDGAWKLPKGEQFYAIALEDTTTTTMSADEIHQLGLTEVARIHAEMRTIMRQVNFDGSLQDFFEFTRSDPQFYYPETAQGKQRYLDEAIEIIDVMKGRLDEVFITKPKADLVVTAVESFREKSAGKAFYQQPAPDGSRPGRYYANLYRMSSMPVYQMEALAYHEGIPGHHMQIAIAQELEGVPSFRKYGRYTAYTEGWGLYSEYFPKEMGFYRDPYSDFGRLAMEIWRACRLVVDTGIHSKHWTREQAIDYLASNTPNPKADVVKAIERYIVTPSQATAYKIGMLKILELRSMAKAKLGSRFELREFHEVVLENGPLPLSVLEEKVMEYVASKQ